MSTNKFTLLLLLCMLSYKSFSQDKFILKKIDFLEAGVFSHSISLPLRASNRLIALNRLPGIKWGVGFNTSKEERRLTTRYLLSLSAYYQKKLHFAYEIRNEWQFNYRIAEFLTLNSGIGLGMLHTFEDGAIYEQKDGTYRQKRDWGRLQVSPNLLFGLESQITKSISLYTNYNFLLQLPFARKAGILFVPHSRVTMGTRLFLTK